MDYLDMVVTTTSIPTLHELVGLEVFSDDYDEASIIGDVQQRLQSLMDALPLMREGYDTAKGAAPYGGTSI
jgi:hypothetical protein